MRPTIQNCFVPTMSADILFLCSTSKGYYTPPPRPQRTSTTTTPLCLNTLAYPANVSTHLNHLPAKLPIHHLKHSSQRTQGRPSVRPQNPSISNHATMRTTLLPLLLALLPPTLSAPAPLSLSAHHNPSISHHPAPTLPAKHIFPQHHHTPTPPPLPFLDPLGLIPPSKAAPPHKAPPPHKALKPPKSTPKKVFKLPKPLLQPTPTSKVWAVAPLSGQRFGSGPEPGT